MTTDAGRLTFAGWQETGGTWTGTWTAPTARSVAYAWRLSDGVNVDRTSYVGRLLSAALPENGSGTVADGQTVRPSAMRALAVNVRNDDSGAPDRNWGTFVFTGWDRDEVSVDGSNVSFTANFAWRPTEWHRAVKLTNVSATQVAGGSDVVIPVDIERRMQLAINPVATVLAGDSSGRKDTWTSPDWRGTKYRDDLNHGTWVFKDWTLRSYAPGGRNITGEGPVSKSSENFPRGTASYGTGSDEDLWLNDRGETVYDRQDLTARWTFRPDPIHILTNQVECDTVVSLQKAFGEITNVFAPQPTDTRDAYTLTASGGSLSTPRRGDGVLLLPNTAAGEPRNLLGSATSLTLTESAKATANPAFVPGAEAWSCTGAAVTNNTDGSARISFGRGARVSCTVKNTPTQVTLLAAYSNGRAGRPSGVVLSATPATGTATARALSVSDTSSAVAATANTGLVRPAREHVLAATAPAGTVLVGFKRYTGTAPNGKVLEESGDVWSPLPASARITPTIGAHEVYVAEFRSVPVPELPFTGGTSTDMWIILGAGGTLLGVLTAAARRRREAEAQV